MKYVANFEVQERKYSKWEEHYPKNSRRVKNINKAVYICTTQELELGYEREPLLYTDAHTLSLFYLVK